MLIRFNVKNVYSFDARENGESEEFSMIAGKVRIKRNHVYDDGSIKLLKFAAVYGANAAGKSNLIKAMELMRRIVLIGNGKGCTEKYCKTNIDNQHKPSYFEMEIMLDNKYYSYGFEIILSENRLLSEWLVELYANNSEKVIFERNIDNGKYKIGGELLKNGLKNKINVYADDIKNDSSILFLNIMNKNKKNLYEDYKNAICLQKLYVWFKNFLKISYPDQPLSDYAYMSKELDKTEEVCKLMSAFDTGISKFHMVDVPLERMKLSFPKHISRDIEERIERLKIRKKVLANIAPESLIMRTRKEFFIVTVYNHNEVKCQTIEFSHSQKNTLFNLNEESDGTVRLLDLLEIILSSDDKTYVIDELDRCLHPSLSYKFVETFFKIAEKKNIQLIVTTHESRLMDFDLLRRDEIWFVNKKYNGTSDIYSLEEYNTRFDQKVDKAYLEGRYGGVPIFNTLFPIEGDNV